jgi:NAD(P)-dependent dehydrogenase (short-subunit alcohol dehydrogenase family)
LVENKFGKLDVLINNAGLGPGHGLHGASALKKKVLLLESKYPGIKRIKGVVVPMMRKSRLLSKKQDASSVNLEIAKEIMETNLFGAWRMIQYFLPLLSKSNDGRIINVSSGSGELASLTGKYPGYSLSKASLNALTIMLANELQGKGIKVNAMCPGWVRTDMGGPNAIRDVSQGADTAVWLAMEENIPSGKFFRDRKAINW